ncbi:hypothetical protein ACLB2K_049934 [Fragaria x ananassa]
MALRNTIMIFLVAVACLGVCSGASSSEAAHSGVVHKVGDSVGWSILGDYKKWASTKEFHVGDTLLFAYNKEYHNLMEVNGEDYQSCNAKSPLALYAAGLDSIPLDKPGDYYFMCGRNFEPYWYAMTLKEPGHCQAGQKLHVKVIEPISDHNSVASPTAAPAPH